MLLTCSYKLVVRLNELNDCTNKADYFIIGDSLSTDRDNIFAAFK